MEGQVRKKRKPANKKDGKVIRVSLAVYNKLNPRAVSSKKGTMDSVLRKILGLPEKGKGEESRARDFWLLPQGGTAHKTKADARGAAILQAISKGSKRPEAPVRFREVL